MDILTEMVIYIYMLDSPLTIDFQTLFMTQWSHETVLFLHKFHFF